MEPSLETHYFCIDHDIWYNREIGSMCPACEAEICGEHDKYLQDKENE